MKKTMNSFTFKGKKYKAIASLTCDGCIFKSQPSCLIMPSFCSSIVRKDNRSVIWIEIIKKRQRAEKRQ